jgi:hypothetical protein
MKLQLYSIGWVKKSVIPRKKKLGVGHPVSIGASPGYPLQHGFRS